MTRCGHIFCCDCISKSIELRSTCPVCHFDFKVTRRRKRQSVSHRYLDDDADTVTATFGDLDEMVSLISKLIRSVEGSSHIDTPSQVDPLLYTWKPLEPLPSQSISTSIALQREGAKLSNINPEQEAEGDTHIIFDFPEYTIQSQAASLLQQEQMPVTNPVFRVGDKVQVASRSWPGMNKPGGTAWITGININPNPNNLQHETYDVKYVLDNTKEKGVEAVYLSTERDLPRSERQRRLSSCVEKSKPESVSKCSVKKSNMEHQNTKDDIEHDATNEDKKNINGVLTSACESCREIDSRPKKKGRKQLLRKDLEKRKIKIVSTSLNEKETQILERFTKQFGIAVSNDIDEEDVTHLIARVDDKNIIKQRTMKYLISLMKGIWIVNVNWLTTCVDKGKIVDEEHYQAYRDAKSTKNKDVPNMARLAKVKSPLFTGVSVLLYGSYPSPSPNKTQLAKLIHYGNGTVYETLDSLWSDVLGMSFLRTSGGISIQGHRRSSLNFHAQIVSVFWFYFFL